MIVLIKILHEKLRTIKSDVIIRIFCFVDIIKLITTYTNHFFEDSIFWKTTRLNTWQDILFSTFLIWNFNCYIKFSKFWISCSKSWLICSCPDILFGIDMSQLFINTDLKCVLSNSHSLNLKSVWHVTEHFLELGPLW